MDVKEADILTYEEARLKLIWKSILSYLKRDLGFIWTEKVKQKFNELGTELDKIKFILERLEQIHSSKSSSNELKDISRIKSKLRKIKSNPRWLKEMNKDLEELFAGIERKTIGRRGFLRMLGRAAAGAIAASSIPSRAAAAEMDFKKHIAQLKREGIPVNDNYYDAGSRNIIYIIPDVHFSSLMLEKRYIIEKLRKYGINQVGLEGIEKDIYGEKEGTKLFEDLKGQYANAQIDEYLTLGGEKPKKIQTFEDFKRSHPLYSLSLDPDYILRGLENKKVMELISEMSFLGLHYKSGYKQIKKEINRTSASLTIIETSWKFGVYKTDEEKKEAAKRHKRDKDYLAKLKPMLAETSEEVNKSYSKVMEKAKALGYAWFNLPDPFSDNFSEAKLYELKQRVILDERSAEAINRIKQIGESMVIVYGRAHLDQLISGLQKAKLSYIILGKEDNTEIVPGFKERMKEIMKDEEMYHTFSYRMGEGYINLKLALEAEEEANKANNPKE